MSYLQQLISNSVLITALIGWFAAQVLKMILVWDKKKFDFKRIIGSGWYAEFTFIFCNGTYNVYRLYARL